MRAVKENIHFLIYNNPRYAFWNEKFGPTISIIRNQRKVSSEAIGSIFWGTNHTKYVVTDEIKERIKKKQKGMNHD